MEIALNIGGMLARRAAEEAARRAAEEAARQAALEAARQAAEAAQRETKARSRLQKSTDSFERSPKPGPNLTGSAPPASTLSQGGMSAAALLRLGASFPVARLSGSEAPQATSRGTSRGAAGSAPAPVVSAPVTAASTGVQPALDLAGNPALQGAVDSYIANPSAANYDALVRQTALAQAQGARTDLDTMLQRLQSDPQAWQTLCAQGFELKALTDFLAQGSELEALLPQLQQWAALRDPALGAVTLDQLLADPALCDRFLRAAETGAVQGSSNPGQPVPYAAPEPMGAVPRVNDFRALMDGDPNVPGKETGFRERALAMLAPGMTYSQAAAMADQRIQELVAGTPALSVMPAWQYAQPAGGASSITFGPGGITVPPLTVAPMTGSALQPLRDRIGEVDTLLTALRTQSPSAADLVLATPLVTQALMQALMDMPEDDPHLQQAWGAVMDSLDRSQALQTASDQAKATDALLDAGLAVVSLVAAGAAAFATGGLAIGLFATGFAAGGIQGARDIAQYRQEEYLSQFNAGGALDFSGVENPSEFMFAAGMLMNTVGMACDVAAMLKLMKAAGLVDDTVDAVQAGFKLAEATTPAIAAELRQASRYQDLSTGARQFLGEWVDPAAPAELKDTLFQVWRQTVGHPDGPRSLKQAVDAGDITAQQAVLWSTRGAPAEDVQRIINTLPDAGVTLTGKQVDRYWNVVKRMADRGFDYAAMGLTAEQDLLARKLVATFSIFPQSTESDLTLQHAAAMIQLLSDGDQALLKAYSAALDLPLKSLEAADAFVASDPFSQLVLRYIAAAHAERKWSSMHLGMLTGAIDRALGPG